MNLRHAFNRLYINLLGHLDITHGTASTSKRISYFPRHGINREKKQI